MTVVLWLVSSALAVVAGLWTAKRRAAKPPPPFPMREMREYFNDRCNVGK